MAQVKLFGYADKISVRPGDAIQFHVNADGTYVAEAQLVRLIHGDEHPMARDLSRKRSTAPPTAPGRWKSNTRRWGHSLK